MSMLTLTWFFLVHSIRIAVWHCLGFGNVTETVAFQVIFTWGDIFIHSYGISIKINIPITFDFMDD